MNRLLPPDPDALHATARWCAGLADRLSDVGRRVGRLSEQIAGDWPDDRGREWSERSALLHRELGRDAQAAADLGAELARRAAAADLGEPTPPPPAGVSPARPPGMRLGGTSATRVDDERGFRIAELPDPTDAPPGPT